MIHVKELRPPIKMTGLSSFMISTDNLTKSYRDIFKTLLVTYPTLVSIAKDYQRGKPFPKEIEISAADLKNFLDQASILDNISLELAVEQKEDLSDIVTDGEINNLNFKPFKHQIEAFNYHISKKKWLLLDSMGLGKTLEIIGSAEILKSRGLIDHCLIICGVNSVKENWATEISKYGNSSCVILGKKIGKRGGVSYASASECAEILKKPIEEFFVITNIEKLRDIKIVDAIKKSKNKFGMIAVDEIHRAANKNSSQGANLLKLNADYMVGATGTLITNSPTSAYLPLAWTQNDHSILTTFRPVYEEKDNDNRVIGYKNLDLLQEEIQACSLRRTLDQVRDDMPPKIIEYERVEMNKEHWNFYWDVRNGVKEEADKVELNASNLLALTVRLRQASVCPSILTTQPIRSSKIDRCVELVEEILSQGEKVVIMSEFVEPVKELEKELTKYHPIVYTGEINAEEREYGKNLFQESSDYNVIIGTHKAMGTGLTLNAAMYMIMLDTPFTYSSFSQSCDRIYRVNNTRAAYIKILEHSATIDRRVHEILDTKKDLGDILVDGKNYKLTASFKDELYKIIKDI